MRPFRRDAWFRTLLIALEVVGLMFRDDLMPPGVVAPYQINLDGGNVSPALEWPTASHHATTASHYPTRVSEWHWRG